MTRIKLTMYHFFISFLLVSTVLLLVIYFWYPGIHSENEDFLTIVVLLVIVDITLGPLMTAIIFKQNFKELKIDLAVIVFIQLSALIYGVHTLFMGRPVFMVFNVDRITAVAVNDIPEGELEKAAEGFESFPLTGPRLIGALLPNNSNERLKLFDQAITGRVDYHQLPEYYVVYDKVRSQVKDKLKSVQELKQKSGEAKSMLDAALADLQLTEEQVGYIPVIVRSNDYIALLQRQNAEVVKYLPIDGW